MMIEVEGNPNSPASEQFVFNELEAPRPVRALKVVVDGQETECDVTGVEPSGRFTPARAVKITDSGAGFAFLIFGGAWGIRLRPRRYAAEAWNLSSKHQWGEPFKIYGEPRDIFYMDTQAFVSKKYARTVIFDGDCGFCQSSIRLGRRLDWLKKIDWRARLEPGLKDIFPQLSSEETQNRMVSIRPDGRSYGGFYAVRDILRFFPLTFLPALLLYVPGVSFVGEPAYQWIAGNRHRFTGKASCSMKN